MVYKPAKINITMKNKASGWLWTCGCIAFACMHMMQPGTKVLFACLVSHTFSTNEQCFSLTINQPTIIFSLTYQPKRTGQAFREKETAFCLHRIWKQDIAISALKPSQVYCLPNANACMQAVPPKASHTD